MKFDVELSQLVTWIMEGIITTGAVYIASMVGDIKRTFSELKDSVETLNKNVAVIIEKTAWHEKTLEKHDERLRGLEIHHSSE